MTDADDRRMREEAARVLLDGSFDPSEARKTLSDARRLLDKLQVADLLDLMVAKKCLRLTVGDFTAELSPDAWPQVVSTPGPLIPAPRAFDNPDERCPCGHNLETEHGPDGGCLMAACPMDLCMSTAEAPPPP